MIKRLPQPSGTGPPTQSATILAVIEAVICANPLTQDSMRANLESHFQKLFGHANCRLFFHLTYAYIEDKGSLMTYLEGMAESAMPPGFTFKGRDPITQTDSRPTGFVARYAGGRSEGHIPRAEPWAAAPATSR